MNVKPARGLLILIDPQIAEVNVHESGSEVCEIHLKIIPHGGMKWLKDALVTSLRIRAYYSDEQAQAAEAILKEEAEKDGAWKPGAPWPPTGPVAEEEVLAEATSDPFGFDAKMRAQEAGDAGTS